MTTLALFTQLEKVSWNVFERTFRSLCKDAAGVELDMIDSSDSQAKISVKKGDVSRIVNVPYVAVADIVFQNLAHAVYEVNKEETVRYDYSDFGVNTGRVVRVRK